MNNIPINSDAIKTQESSPFWKIDVSKKGSYSIVHSQAEPIPDESLAALCSIILTNDQPTVNSEVKDLKGLRGCAKDIYKSYMDKQGILGRLKHTIVSWLNPTSSAHRIDQTYQSILKNTSAFADQPIPITNRISSLYNKLPPIHEPDTVYDDQGNFIIEEPDFESSSEISPEAPKKKTEE